MKRFAREVLVWWAVGLTLMADGLKEPRKVKPRIPKPSWYDRVNDKEDRAN